MKFLDRLKKIGERERKIKEILDKKLSDEQKLALELISAESKLSSFYYLIRGIIAAFFVMFMITFVAIAGEFRFVVENILNIKNISEMAGVQKFYSVIPSLVFIMLVMAAIVFLTSLWCEIKQKKRIRELERKILVSETTRDLLDFYERRLPR